MKRWKKMVWIFLILFVTPIVVMWYLITQPLWSQNTTSKLKVDVKKLEQHVVKLAEDFYPRHSDDLKNLNLCADYIYDELKKTKATVAFQEFVVNGKQYKNVTALFGSSDQERIVVGAHYDACGFTPGADDNASGVAGILELAHLLDKHPLTQTIELVCYTLEEPPFFSTEEMGSAYHAKEANKNGIPIKLMISLEMIGYFTDEKEQEYPFPLLKLFYPSTGNFIALVSLFEHRAATKKFKSGMAGTSELPIYSMNAPSFVVGIDFSDHRNYWPYNIPALMVTDTAFYRNFEYHQKGDTPERLDYNKMGQVIIGVYEAIKQF